MKTSNKLLIAFAAALILLPLLGMVIVSRVYYEKGDPMRDFAEVVKSFDTPTKYLTNIATSTFEGVNISETKGLMINVHLIKDSKYGVKVSSVAKDRIQINVDANGQLQLRLKKSGEAAHGIGSIDLYVFSPTVSTLNLTDIGEANLYVEQDAIHINSTNTGSIYFHEQTLLNKLFITGDASELKFANLTMSSIDLNLSKTNVEIHESTIQDLTINSKGKADIDILGDRDNVDHYKISNLIIHTTDSAKVNIAATQVAKASGKFSDQTRVEMPAVNLNQMYLNK